MKIDIRKVETLKVTMMKADPSDLKVLVPLEGGAWSDYGPISQIRLTPVCPNRPPTPYHDA